MKKVLVTGGGGFVGSHIVRLLQKKKSIEPIVVGRNRYPELEKGGVRCLRGDISNQQEMHTIIRDVDTVFHVAALAGIWGKWEDYQRINVEGTANVVSACKQNGIKRLIYTSTPSVVFNGRDIDAGDEGLPYAEKFLCHYAKSKMIAEKLILSVDHPHLSCCAIRPHLVWGPGDPHLIPRLLERGRMKKLKKVGKCTNMVDISYVENVASAHILAAENLENSGTAAGKAYFISQGEAVNLWDWIDELFAQFKIPVIQKKVSFPVAYMAGYFLEGLHHLFMSENEPQMTRFLAEQLALSHNFSIENAQNDFGYFPAINTQEGMKRMLEDYAK